MWLTQSDQMLNNGLEIWKLIIAAVNGYCLGGGMTLLFATDIRIASASASFSLAEVKRGIVPGNGGTQRILSQVPQAIAMEWLLTGDPFDAYEAARWGLINEVVAPEQLIEKAYEYARRVTANAPLAVQAAKELAIRSRDMDLNSGLRMESQVSRLLATSEDAVEGPAAFSEKRDPKWKGK